MGSVTPAHPKLMWSGPKVSPPESRFWVLVDKQGFDGCWIFRKGPPLTNYRTLRVFQKKILAHRYSWELHRGPIPSGLFVLHHCDVPACVNPDHLFLGTKKDNAIDREGKGRGVHYQGASHGRAVLTEKQVRFIRRRHIPQDRRYGTEALARRYGVSSFTIYAILKRLTWKSV